MTRPALASAMFRGPMNRFDEPDYVPAESVDEFVVEVGDVIEADCEERRYMIAGDWRLTVDATVEGFEIVLIERRVAFRNKLMLWSVDTRTDPLSKAICAGIRERYRQPDMRKWLYDEWQEASEKARLDQC